MLAYSITNLKNGKRYIGITSGALEVRWAQHLRSVANGSKATIHRAIRRYGADMFVVEQIASLLPGLPWADLCLLETTLIAQEGAKVPHGYNLTEGGDGTHGYRPTPETLAKMRARRASPETRAKMSAAHTGRQWSESTRAKLVGREHPSKGKKLGERGPMSEENKAKLRAAWTSERRAANAERARLQLAGKRGLQLGKKWTDEQRGAHSDRIKASPRVQAILSERNKSEKQRAAVSAAQTARYAKA